MGLFDAYIQIKYFGTLVQTAIISYSQKQI